VSAFAQLTDVPSHTSAAAMGQNRRSASSTKTSGDGRVPDLQNRHGQKGDLLHRAPRQERVQKGTLWGLQLKVGNDDEDKCARTNAASDCRHRATSCACHRVVAKHPGEVINGQSHRGTGMDAIENDQLIGKKER
jgi:hypothetical protein